MLNHIEECFSKVKNFGKEQPVDGEESLKHRIKAGSYETTRKNCKTHHFISWKRYRYARQAILQYIKTALVSFLDIMNDDKLTNGQVCCFRLGLSSSNEIRMKAKAYSEASLLDICHVISLNARNATSNRKNVIDRDSFNYIPVVILWSQLKCLQV